MPPCYVNRTKSIPKVIKLMNLQNNYIQLIVLCPLNGAVRKLSHNFEISDTLFKNSENSFIVINSEFSSVFTMKTKASSLTKYCQNNSKFDSLIENKILWLTIPTVPKILQVCFIDLWLDLFCILLRKALQKEAEEKPSFWRFAWSVSKKPFFKIKFCEFPNVIARWNSFYHPNRIAL